MSDRDTVIGFCHGEGNCIDCGKRFSFNAIHPRVRCSECEMLLPLLRKKVKA